MARRISRKQRAANARNLKKAQAARRRKSGGGRRRRASSRKRNPSRRKRTARKTTRRRRRRTNPAGVPVVLVNPTRGRTVKRRTRKARRRRRSPARRRRVYARRRRNPRVKFWDAMKSFGIGGAGGMVAYGVDYGASMAPVSPAWQAVIAAAGGFAAGAGVGMLVDERAAAGVGGGTAALLLNRGRELYAMHRAAEGKSTSEGEGEAGKVFRESGALLGPGGRIRADDPAAMSRDSMPAKSFKEAAATRYIPGGQRYFGPSSWAVRYGDAGRVVPRDAGVVYVSGHNR